MAVDFGRCVDSLYYSWVGKIRAAAVFLRNQDVITPEIALTEGIAALFLKLAHMGLHFVDKLPLWTHEGRLCAL
jgi:hypothetical protein